jgi:hypothetical protein
MIYGLTSRCSGLAALAAELDFVRRGVPPRMDGEEAGLWMKPGFLGAA